MYNYLIDIDGTVTDDVPNEDSHLMPLAVPFRGAVDAVNRIHTGNTVTFFTSRTEDMRDMTREWLDRWGFRYHGLITGKPRGGKYVWIDNLKVSTLRYPDEIAWEAP